MIQLPFHRSGPACPSFFTILVLAVGMAPSGAEGKTPSMTEAEAEAEYDRRMAVCEAQLYAGEKSTYAFAQRRSVREMSEFEDAMDQLIEDFMACQAAVEEPRWDIPERLMIRYGEPESTPSYRPAPCESCLDGWEAMDVAQAFLDQFEISSPDRMLTKSDPTFMPKPYLAEIVEDFPWSGLGDWMTTWNRVGSLWVFGYAFGIRYHGEQVAIQYPKADLTWRVWYQTGWIMSEEIAHAVKKGFLSEEALEWGRQRRSELLLVHARTGFVHLPEDGRDLWSEVSSEWTPNEYWKAPRFGCYRSQGSWNLAAYNTAQKAASQRAKLLLPKSSDPL